MWSRRFRGRHMCGSRQQSAPHFYDANHPASAKGHCSDSINIPAANWASLWNKLPYLVESKVAVFFSLRLFIVSCHRLAELKMLAVEELMSLMWCNADPENFSVQCELMKTWFCRTWKPFWWSTREHLNSSRVQRHVFSLSGQIPPSAASGTAKLYVRQLFNWFFSSCNSFILCKNKNISGAQNHLLGFVFYSPINYFWRESLFII